MSAKVPTPPTAIEMEQATIGALLLDRDAILGVASWLQPTDFYLPKHEWIYESVLACYSRRVPPDVQTVAADLQARGRLDDIGGIPALIGLSNGTLIAYHVEHYGRAVADAASRRRLITAGGKMAALGFDTERSLSDLYADATNLLTTATNQRHTQGGLMSLAAICDEVYADLDSEIPSGVESGLVDLDRITGGFHGTDLVIWAGRPGQGKTSVALSVTLNLIERGYPVAYFSLEMGRKQLVQRLLSMLTGISVQAIRQRSLGSDDLIRLNDAFARLSRLPLAIDDAPGLFVDEMRRRALQHAANLDKAPIIVIDYVQLLQANVGRENRNNEVAKISRETKGLAKELDTTVIALAQLSRAVEGRVSKVPTLADLRDSGQLEQDADQVTFIYREEMYDPTSTKKGIAEMHIAKHRHGPVGVVACQFEAKTTRFRDLAPYQSPEGY